MSSYVISCCSTADLTEEHFSKREISYICFHYKLNDTEYADDLGKSMPFDQFYAAMAAGASTKTSQVNADEFEAYFETFLQDGKDILHVCLSSGLSGTYNMVRLQAGQRDDLEIAVFDSRSGSLGIGIMVLQLWEEIVAGASWETLVRERAPHLVANTFPFFSVDTLEYLRRGGRIGRITALAGTMLSIKPIITFSDDGQLQSIAKVRGRRQVQDKILELLRARFQSGRRYNLAVANGGAPEEMAEFAARLKAEFPNYEHFWEGVMDATLSVYIGDGVIGGGIQFLD